MGNLQQQCRGITNTHLELDRPDAIYLPNETISGTISYLKQANASIILTGIIHFKKRKKTRLEKCRIIFFKTEFHLILSSNKKQNFQLHLDNDLPPSFNTIDTYPNIIYSINLIYNKNKNQIQSSIPIYVSPQVHIDRPLLLTPLFFGPIENQLTGIKLQMKINRAVFTFDDIIKIYYEIQNPNQIYIHKIEISLGIYYLIESNIYQEDLCNGIENFNNISSNNKLIQNKVLLNIPKKIYLPPTYKFQYGREGDQSSFNLIIDYKIQCKIFLTNEDNLWQADIPIVLCNQILNDIDITKEEDMNINNERNSEFFDMNVNIVE